MSDVDEILNGAAFHLLLFSVGGICFGAETGQVTEIAVYNGEKGEDLFWFHEEMGYAGKTVTYQSPVIVTIKSGTASPYRVIIDSMEDITEFSQSDITLFPPLLEPFVLRRGLWGLLPQQERIVLLLDFQRLLREKSAGKSI